MAEGDIWISAAAFEASTASSAGGMEVVWIPASARLENVTIPPEPALGDPESGFAPVTFQYGGQEYTATLYDFKVVGSCAEADEA